MVANTPIMIDMISSAIQVLQRIFRLSTQGKDSANAENHIALSGLSLPDIESFVEKLGLPRFRANQIHSWIYSKYAGSFDEMTNLSVDLREKLKTLAQVPVLDIAHLQVSRDETR